MTFFELSSWIILGAAVAVLVAVFRPTEGLTWRRALGVGAFGGVIGGLIERILAPPGQSSAELGLVTPALIFAGLGALATVLIARHQLQDRERLRLS